MKRIRLLCLLALLAATFFRFYRLPELPPGLNFDEAGSGVLALEILQGAPRLWWRIGGGQEPLWPYLAALSTAIWGPIPLSLRFPAAVIGVLTVAAVYPLVLRLFPGRQATWLAFLTMLGLAFSEWHLHFSRLGFRAILLPLLSTLAFYFLWKVLGSGGAGEQGSRGAGERGSGGAEGSRTTDHGPRTTHHALRTTHYALRFTLLSSFFLSLAIYAYLAGRLLPGVVGLFVGLSALIHYGRGREKEQVARFSVRPYLSLLLELFIPLLLFLLPLILYFSFNPDDFMARSATVSIFNPAWHGGDLAGTFWRTTRLTLGTFLGGEGDANPLVNLPGEPALPPLLAIFFGIGWLVSVVQSVKDGRLRGRSGPEDGFNPYLFLICWWGIMLLPAILAPEGAPHHLRLLGTIVPAYILVAMGLLSTGNLLGRLLAWLLARLSSLSSVTPYALRTTPYGPRLTDHAPRITSYTFPLLCFLFIAAQTYSHYFYLWPGLTDFTLPFDLYAVHLAEEMGQAPPEVAYILPMDIRAGAEARHYTLDYLLAGSRPGASYTYIPVDERNAEKLLAEASAGKQELRVVRWTADKHHEADAKEIVTFLLEMGAQAAGRESFPIYDIETYHPFQGKSQAAGFRLPAIDRPVGANLDGLLRLEAAFVAETAKPGTWLPVALRLAPLAPMAADYKISLRLIGPDGARLVQKDRTLWHNFHQGTSLWPPETVNEYYLLPVPTEIPPGAYQVVAVIYHPETLAPLVAEGVVEVPLGVVEVQ